jgi:hypothetical protein
MKHLGETRTRQVELTPQYTRGRIVTVSALICWIGVQKLNIHGLHVYMDNFFGWDYSDNLVSFQGQKRPKRQIQLLLLWQRICCPYDLPKQEQGNPLKIIGFWVDINLGTISLSPSSIEAIIHEINTFLANTSCQQPSREWQHLAGHLNWLLNVLPCGRPALSELYRKMHGKSKASAKIFLNATIVMIFNGSLTPFLKLLEFNFLMMAFGRIQMLTLPFGQMPISRMA